jgi:uncharacterized protein YcaQ
MKEDKISIQLARKLFLQSQLLSGKAKSVRGKKGVLQSINKLGYVQIDPLSVIERAHHHTLWTRLPDYDTSILNELQAKDRHIFEYWGHALSYLPMTDYRYFIPRMDNFRNPKTKWVQILIDQGEPLMQPVLDRIRNEGPLSIKEIEEGSNVKNEQDYKKSVRATLDLLFWRGDLMVSKRNNLQKYYDLTERVIPGNLNITIPGNNEICEFLVGRALSAFGIAQEKEIRLFMQPESSRDFHFLAASNKIISSYLKEIIHSGSVIPLKIDGIEAKFYAMKGNIERISNLKQVPPSVFILSPFDNLIIRRQRTKLLFGFDYSLECYTPAAKRKYGYFVLPILWGEDFVGRMDAKADRKNAVLKIINLVFEPEFNSFGDFLPLFSEKLVDFARFNKCKLIEFDKVAPAKVKSELVQLVKK